MTSWTVAHWAPQTMEFSRHEYCSGKPAPSPRDLPHPGKYHKPPLKSSDLPSTFQGIHQQLLAVLCGRLQSRPNTSFGPRGPSPAGQSLYIWRADEGWRLVSCPGGWGWLGLWTQPLPDKLHPPHLAHCPVVHPFQPRSAAPGHKCLP